MGFGNSFTGEKKKGLVYPRAQIDSPQVSKALGGDSESACDQFWKGECVCAGVVAGVQRSTWLQSLPAVIQGPALGFVSQRNTGSVLFFWQVCSAGHGA